MPEKRCKLVALVPPSMLAFGASFCSPWEAELETRGTVAQTRAVQEKEDPVPAPSALEQKVQSVLPRPEEERWLRIPWQPNLMKARLEAQRSGKPMLIWVMDGNVLGCT